MIGENVNARGERVFLTLGCEVRQGSRPWQRIMLNDLSSTGFRIGNWPQCRPDLTVRIRIPGLQMLSADVRWMRDSIVGCAFTAPLHVAVFEHLAEKAGSF